MAWRVTKVAGVSSVVVSLKIVCRLVKKYRSAIEAHIPPENVTLYNQYMDGIEAACDFMEDFARSLIEIVITP